MARIEGVMQDDAILILPCKRSASAVYDKQVMSSKLHPSRFMFRCELPGATQVRFPGTASSSGGARTIVKNV